MILNAISNPIVTSVRPRQLVHRGALCASAIWFEFSLCGLEESRRRVLEFWQSGARVWEIAGGFLVQFAAPRTLRAETVPGTLLFEREGWLLACPLSESEWRGARSPDALALPQKMKAPAELAPNLALDLARSSGHNRVSSESNFASPTLLFPRGGALCLARDAKSVDPSQWIEIESWQTCELTPLGEVAAPVLALSETSFEARRALDVPASPELERFLAQMRGETLSENAPKSWREKWESLWHLGRREDDFSAPKTGGTRVRNRGFWAELFQFRFGASGEAPALESGAQFSSELELVARPALILAALSFFVALLIGVSSGRDAMVFLVGALGSLLVLLLMAWGFLLLARLVPTPAHLAHKPRKRGAAWSQAISFDLLSLLLVCGGILVLARSGDWLWVIFGIGLAFYMALEAHWKRRRADEWGGNTGAASSEKRGWMARLSGLFGGKKGGAAGAQAAPKPRRALGLNAFLWRTELARLFGMRQARYMMKMMQMFERGDLDSALRHAVPFNLFENGDSAPALGVPKARGDLDFLGARGAGGVGVPLPPEIKAALTRHYRAAFEALSAQNRVDEAAFVLAELLDSPLEAVQWLEKHQKWKTAAQLAQTRHLDAGLAVRLWWLAGEKERAIALARRLGAFADAVSRLENGDQTQREAARALRVLWAQFLANGGDFAGAVEAAWPVVASAPALRGVIGVWIERGLESEGPSRARMLARQAHFLDELSPSTKENWRDSVGDLLGDQSLEGVPARLAFASLLGGAQSSDWTRAAARRAVRALTRDAALFPQWSAALQREIQSLLSAASDAALRADWNTKNWPAAPPNLVARSEALTLEIDANDAGNLAIWDAAWLDDGRALIALGESGAQLLNRDGKVVARFDLPCHRLVMGESNQAIGVALRGLEFQARFEGDNEGFDAFVNEMGLGEFVRRAGLARLCRFDLNRKTAQSWGEIGELSAFTSESRGGQWMVSSGEEMLSLDTTANAPTVLWRSGESGTAAMISQNEDSLALLTKFYSAGTRPRPERATRTEVWRFDWPSLVLRERRLVSPDAIKRGERPFLSPDGWTLWMPHLFDSSVGEKPNEIFKDWNTKTATLPLSPPEKPLQIEQRGAFLTTLSASGEDLHLRLWAHHQDPPRLCWHLILRVTSRARFRLSDETLSVCDSRGRFLVIDLSTGDVLRNQRLF